MYKIILASNSKVRKEILEKNGIKCDVQPSSIDENPIKESLLKEGASPEIISKNLAELKEKTMIYDPKFTSEIIGIEMSPSNMVTCLKKCRLDASIKGKKITCIIPRYRFDIFSPMDLTEEIALGYGIAKIEPKLSPSTTIGQKNDVTIKTKLLSKTAVGLGFLEAMNSSLTSKKSIAKVWLKKGTGKIYVNGKLFNEYFVSENHKMQITSLLVVSDKDYKKNKQKLKGIIHIHVLLKNGIQWQIEKKSFY